MPRKTLTTKEWVEKAKSVHGDFYTYENVDYKGSNTKVSITCSIHGEFLQVPATHTRGSGCKYCGTLTASRKCNKGDAFIHRATAVHNNTYSYTDVVYTNSVTKVIIKCAICDHVFQQTPSDHLSGYGCSKCAGTYSPTTSEYVAYLENVHGNKYEYCKVRYTNNQTKIVLSCKTHGDFGITPNKLQAGRGCPKCASHGFDKTKPALLYYLKIVVPHRITKYKIGITNRSVNERFSALELSHITVLWTKAFEKGEDAYVEEQKILRDNIEFRYNGPNILISGNTELFTENILKLA